MRARLLLLAGLAAGPAYAADGQSDVQSIRLDTPCLAAVHVRVDPALSHGGRWHSDAAINAVTQQDNHQVLLGAACGPQTLTLDIAPQTGLSIAPSRTTRYAVEGPVTALAASLSGGSLDLAEVKAAQLGLSGNAQVHVAQLSGPIQISAQENAQITIDAARTSAMSAQFLGNATATIRGAKIGALNLVTAQHAHVTVWGEASVATLTSHGDAVIDVEKVSGVLLRHGDGGVRVSQYNGMVVDRHDLGLPDVPKAPTPPTDVPPPPPPPAPPPPAPPAPMQSGEP